MRIARLGRLVALAALLAAISAAAPSPAQALKGQLDLVGYNALNARGLNSVIAIGGGFAYVGSFGDSTRPEAGVAILSLADPANPQLVGRIPPATGRWTNELRLWPRAGVLAVLAGGCKSPFCVDSTPASQQLLFYDVSGANATSPVLLQTLELPTPSEDLFLWQDPRRPERALLYVTSVIPGTPNITVFDISGIRAGGVQFVDDWTVPTSAGVNGVHSVSVTADGRRLYVAAFDAGYFLLSNAELARRSAGARIRKLTPIKRRITYEGVNGHSAYELPGGEFALVSDEIYSCPWGWARTLDVSDPRRPRVVGEARVPPYNDPSLCRASNPRDAALLAGTAHQTFSAHDETLTCNLLLASWYGSGVQAFSLRKPAKPRRLAAFNPVALSSVQAEQPDFQHVVMHSYPTVHNGLIYVVDIRNGLYVLRYRGPHQREVERAGYLAGNSNLTGGGRSLPPKENRCGRSRSSSKRR